VPEELWPKVHHIEVQEAVIPKKKQCKNAKWLSEEGVFAMTSVFSWQNYFVL